MAPTSGRGLTRVRVNPGVLVQFEKLLGDTGGWGRGSATSLCFVYCLIREVVEWGKRDPPERVGGTVGDENSRNEPILISGKAQEFADGPDLKVVFSNSARVAFSAEDVSLSFGLRDVNNPALTHLELRVYMSLPHAKRLAVAMARSIRRIEEAFGHEIEANPANAFSEKERTHPEEGNTADEAESP